MTVGRHGGGYGGFKARWIDIRVQDNPAPIEELIRIFNVYDLTLLTREDPKDVVVLKPNVVREIQAGLGALRLYPGPGAGNVDAKSKAPVQSSGAMYNYHSKLRNSLKLRGKLPR